MLAFQNMEVILSAAISAIACTAVGAMKNMVEHVIMKKRRLYGMYSSTKHSYEKRKIANIILETVVLGFKQVEFSYRKYVSVSEKEV